MSSPDFSIIPYHPSYEAELLKLEQESPQGKLIQLDMVKANYLSRSVVFDNYLIAMAVGSQGELMGVAAGADLPLLRNGVRVKAGLGYDARVGRKFRGYGIAKQLILYLRENFFRPSGINFLYLTMKSSNQAVYRASKILDDTLFQYPFRYLTLSVRTLAKNTLPLSLRSPLRIAMLGSAEPLDGYLEPVESGLWLWHTHQMYQIRIRHVHPLLKLGFGVLDLFRSKANKLPREGDIISFALLGTDEELQEGDLTTALGRLQAQHINYLVAICRQNDPMYRQLKPFALDDLPYTLLTTLPLQPADRITLDVRCL